MNIQVDIEQALGNWGEYTSPNDQMGEASHLEVFPT